MKTEWWAASAFKKNKLKIKDSQSLIRPRVKSENCYKVTLGHKGRSRWRVGWTRPPSSHCCHGVITAL